MVPVVWSAPGAQDVKARCGGAPEPLRSEDELQRVGVSADEEDVALVHRQRFEPCLGPLDHMFEAWFVEVSDDA